MKSLKMLLSVAFTVLSVYVVAQDSTSHKEKAHKHQSEKMKYSCPMHPEVTSDKPGKCSKCGMDLVKSDNDTVKMYACPMHPEVTSDKPGKCSKCGMDLKEKQPAAIAYSCPMKCEGDKTYDKPGTCPKCGMALKEQKNKQSN